MDHQGHPWTQQFIGEETKAQEEQTRQHGVRDRCSELALGRVGRGEDSSHQAQLGLTGRGVWLQPSFWQQRLLEPCSSQGSW